MRTKGVLVLSVPRDVELWIRREAGLRRMRLGDYATVLLTAGIERLAIDEHVALLRNAALADGLLAAIYRETVITRELMLANLPEARRASVLRSACEQAAAGLRAYGIQENGHVVRTEQLAEGPDPRLGGGAP